jgi:hypothetical protein
MKVYRISKWAFGGICLLIVLLPISRHWKVLTTGEHTSGTVTGFEYRMAEDVAGERYAVEASEIEFTVNGNVHKTYGPVNYEYKAGRKVRIYYDPDDPGVNCVATFTGFYLNYYAVLPIVLLALWYAFYLSFNNYRKKMKMPKFTSGAGQDPPSKKAIQNSGKLPF